jgi:hypothetical protein
VSVTASPVGSETAEAEGVTAPEEAGGSGRSRVWRTPIVIVIVVLLAGTAIALLQPSPATGGYLSPDDTLRTGTHALTHILAARGVRERTVTTAAAATDAAAAGGTLVITSPYLLTKAELRALGRSPADLVIVEPDEETLDALAPQVSQSGGGPVSTLLPACHLRAAMLAGPASVGGPGLQVQAGTPGAVSCYISAGLPTLVQLRHGGRTVTLLSSGAPLTNGYLAKEGNAALAINLLSAGSQVVWLVPQVGAGGGPGGIGGSSRSLSSQVPLAAYLVAIQLGVALLLVALWRSRRLGPLITEPLPVVVRASETVEGHARLYRSRRARDRVAATLRAAAVARLAPMIGLPAGAPAAAVTAALAARSALGQERIDALLYGPPPATDAALVTLASDLDALEGEVRS